MLPPIKEILFRDISSIPEKRGSCNPTYDIDCICLNTSYFRSIGISLIGTRVCQCDALSLGEKCVLVGDGMGDSEKGGKLIAPMVSEVFSTLINSGWSMENIEEEISSILGDLIDLETTGAPYDQKLYVLDDCYINSSGDDEKFTRFSSDLYKIVKDCWEEGDYGFASKVQGELTDLTLAYLCFKKGGRPRTAEIEIWGDTRIDHFPSHGRARHYGPYFDLDSNLDEKELGYQAKKWLLECLNFAYDRREDLIEIQEEEGQSQEELLESKLTIEWIEPQISYLEELYSDIDSQKTRKEIWNFVDVALNMPVVVKHRLTTVPTGFLHGRKFEDEWCRVPDVAEVIKLNKGDIVTLKTDGYSKIITPYKEEVIIKKAKEQPDRFSGKNLCENVAFGIYNLIKEITSGRDFFTKGRFENTAYIVLEIL